MPEYSTVLEIGSVLDQRYRIISVLGGGGFGRTYLAADKLRYPEKCVLKEFAPQVESSYQLAKAEELFEREAGILKRLQHKQIPRLRKLLRLKANGKESLFIVQDYIKGQSYWQLFKAGKRFDQQEITELLLDLLPVLDYIHSQGLVHRDISPDNLIKRDTDGKPVLIDFGCVKVAANAVSGATGKPITIVGKKGYAPEEQMFYGQAFPHSDLYALAVTSLVLLTGKLPQDLYDGNRAIWNWRREVKVSANLADVLDKMLAYRPRDRYSSAQEVYQALKQQSTATEGIFSSLRTLVVAPAGSKTTKRVNHTSLTVPKFEAFFPKFKINLISRLPQIKPPKLNYRNPKFFKNWRVAAMISAIVLPAIIAFTGVRFFSSLPSLLISTTNTPLTKSELNEQKYIYERVQALGINEGVFYEQVDSLFYAKYPELRNTQLTDQVEHQEFRKAWYQIADNLLDKLEQGQQI